MRVAAQQAEHARCIRLINGLAQYFIAQNDDGVCAQHDKGVWIIAKIAFFIAEDGFCFFERKSFGESIGGSCGWRCSGMCAGKTWKVYPA